jgi:hypothetical protein
MYCRAHADKTGKWRGVGGEPAAVIDQQPVDLGLPGLCVFEIQVQVRPCLHLPKGIFYIFRSLYISLMFYQNYFYPSHHLNLFLYHCSG